MPKCHWLPFLVWCISGSRALLLFLVEDGAAMIVAIDDRALAHQQAALLQHRPDLVEQRPRQVMLLQPMAEVQHRRRVRNRRHRPGRCRQSRASPGCRRARPPGLVGQPVPLLQKVRAAASAPARSAAARARPSGNTVADRSTSRAHGTTLLHLAQKAFPPRLSFLPSVFRLRKAPLPLHRSVPSVPPHPQDSTRRARPISLDLFSVPLAVSRSDVDDGSPTVATAMTRL